MIATGTMKAFALFNGGGDGADREQPPRLDELLRVVAIAQVVSRGNVSFTLFSLEAYDDGFVVHGRHRLEEGHPVLDDIRRRWEEVRRRRVEAAKSAPGGMTDPARASDNLRLLSERPIARIEPTATDDRGNRYRSWLAGGRGMAEEVHFSYSFTPPIDPAARELRIEIPALHWLVQEPGGDRRIEGDSEPGPWSFAIPLPTDKA